MTILEFATLLNGIGVFAVGLVALLSYRKTGLIAKHTNSLVDALVKKTEKEALARGKKIILNGQAADRADGNGSPAAG